MLNLKNKRVLVTGGAGFIGSHLCATLLEQGCHVYAIDNFATSSPKNIREIKKNKKFHFSRGSILNEKLMRKLIRNCEIIYHLAAAVGVRYITDHTLESILTNINGTEIVLKLASRYQKKVLVASSSEVYGKHMTSDPIHENDNRILGPTDVRRWSYAEAKAMDEFLAFAYARQKKLKVINLRFFNVVGPMQSGVYGMVVPRFIHEALANETMRVFGSGDQIRSFTHVHDAVRAIIDLSRTPQAYGQVFNIGNDLAVISIKELAKKIKKLTHSKSQIVFEPYKVFYGNRFEDVPIRIPDISKIRQTINFKPHFNMDQILADIIVYAKEHKL